MDENLRKCLDENGFTEASGYNEKMVDPNHLRPCPFCGKAPIVREAAWTGLIYVCCRNKKCLVQPSTMNDINNYNGLSPVQVTRKSIRAWNSLLN